MGVSRDLRVSSKASAKGVGLRVMDSHTNPKQTVDPSCAQHVKTPRQPIRTPVSPSPIPSYNRQNWNQRMEKDLGAGFFFEKNTDDHPLKHREHRFDGKSDEGFLVGYSVNSKAFRVYNLVTKRVEVNLHVNFLEEKPNVQGLGHRLKRLSLTLHVVSSTSRPIPSGSEHNATKEDSLHSTSHFYSNNPNLLMTLLSKLPSTPIETTLPLSERGVCDCSRFRYCPKTLNLNSFKRKIKYLARANPNLGLWYPRDSPLDLESHFTVVPKWWFQPMTGNPQQVVESNFSLYLYLDLSQAKQENN
ncbi:hypothetical protein Tco_1092135 [Tanacetum coccineum]|uniref:Retroviral polymerase SH3-like domain-containing protein n=1 Tax=Tanacetum coccineum TaxID=301880 RepID=A0ABQ5I8Z5_9ASTR